MNGVLIIFFLKSLKKGFLYQYFLIFVTFKNWNILEDLARFWYLKALFFTEIGLRKHKKARLV